MSGRSLPTAEAFSSALRDAIASQELADSHKAAVTKMLSQVVRALIKPGYIIEAFCRPFGRVYVAHGNARGVRRFEVASNPLIRNDWGVHHISLAQFLVEAHPLNDAGKRLSGRAGNSKNLTGRKDLATVTLQVQIATEHGFDDQRSDLEIVLTTLEAARAAQ